MQETSSTELPINRATVHNSTQVNDSQKIGTGVVLRWRASKLNENIAPIQSNQNTFRENNFGSQAAVQDIDDARQTRDILSQNIDTGSANEGHWQNNDHQESGQTEFDQDNPLRPASGIRERDERTLRSAVYQQEPSRVNRVAHADSSQPLQWSRGQGEAQRTRLTQQADSTDSTSPPPNAFRLPDAPNIQEPSLESGNAAPAPPSVLESPELDPPSFPPQHGEDGSPADRSKRDTQTSPRSELPLDRNQNNGDRQRADELEDIVRKAKQSSLPNCASQRELLKGQPLTSISLNVSPNLSDGLRALKKDPTEHDEKIRTDVDKRSMVRQWTNYKGEPVATGRMVDLSFGNVVLEGQSGKQMIPVADLSDVDMSYVSELWNLPTRCGSGYEPHTGRCFIDSTVQWKASGACSNPLYFEQVQLERYGHETGPVLQPMISSARFLGGLVLLPYKVGLNPPTECKYALGYYRPGSCAPYMVEPFPLSLRAGLAQAGFWTAAPALFP
jgi:hypothetical protein